MTFRWLGTNNNMGSDQGQSLSMLSVLLNETIAQGGCLETSRSKGSVAKNLHAKA